MDKSKQSPACIVHKQEKHVRHTAQPHPGAQACQLSTDAGAGTTVGYLSAGWSSSWPEVHAVLQKLLGFGG